MPPWMRQGVPRQGGVSSTSCSSPSNEPCRGKSVGTRGRCRRAGKPVAGVAAATLSGLWRLLMHQRRALAHANHLAVLVVARVLELDDAGVGPRLALPLAEHLRV